MFFLVKSDDNVSKLNQLNYGARFEQFSPCFLHTNDKYA